MVSGLGSNNGQFTFDGVGGRLCDASPKTGGGPGGVCVVTVGLYSDIIHSGEVLGIVSPWVGGEVCGEYFYFLFYFYFCRDTSLLGTIASATQL